MAPVPEDALRALLADLDDDAFAAFVADLWRARGVDVHREGDVLAGDGVALAPARSLEAVDAGDDVRPVVATELPPNAPDDAVGPADLHRVLLYDVERQRAAALFERHFDRPLDCDWSGGDWLPGRGPAPETDDDPADPGPAGGALARVAAAVPDRGAVLALAGDRRVQAVLLAVLAVTASSAWVLFAHQPGPAEAGSPPFAVEDGRVPFDGPFRVVGRTTADGPAGRFYYAQVRTFAPGDPAVEFERLTFDGVGSRLTMTSYQRGTVKYARYGWDNGSRFRDRRVPSDETVVHVANTSRAVYTVEETRAPGGAPTRHTFGLTLNVLGRLPYERAGTATYEGRRVVRYEPTAGWTYRALGIRDEPRRLRVRSASGTVLVDAETGAVLFADVEARIVRASTWAEVYLNRTTTLSARFRVRSAVPRPKAPPWVAGLANATGNASG